MTGRNTGMGAVEGGRMVHALTNRQAGHTGGKRAQSGVVGCICRFCDDRKTVFMCISMNITCFYV